MGVRIGLAYNLKPQAAAIAGGDFASPVDRNTALRALRTDLDQPDLYAEWDEPGTIDAIERALRPLGQVIRLEADASFPQKLADARPDFVFNIAEGLYGPNREGHVPAICEFYGIPCHASDPLTLGARPPQGARQGGHGGARGARPRRSAIAESVADAAACTLPFPLFVKPALRGIGQGDHGRTTSATTAPRSSAGWSTCSPPTASRCSIEAWLPGRSSPWRSSATAPEARCLPIVAMDYADLPEGAPPIYGYEAKWLWDTLDNPLDIYECPAQIPESLARRDPRRVPRRLPRARAAATGAGSTSAATPTATPWWWS